MVVFYAGLRPCRAGGADRAGKLIYAIIGLYRVSEVVKLAAVAQPRWHENAHTRRAMPTPEDVIVRASPGKSGRLRRCLPIGDWRDRAYRVFPALLSSWGHLSCRDGYISRPPPRGGPREIESRSPPPAAEFGIDKPAPLDFFLPPSRRHVPPFRRAKFDSDDQERAPNSGSPYVSADAKLRESHAGSRDR